MPNYTGPRWLKPLSLAVAFGVAFFLIAITVMDTETEWE